MVRRSPELGSLKWLAAMLLVMSPETARAGLPLVEPRRPVESSGHGPRAYVELGRASFGDGEFKGNQMGLRFVSMTPNQPSLDFELAAWLAPGAIITPDLDLAYPIALGPDVRIAPRVGLSGLLAGGGGFLYLAAGMNAGVGFIANPKGPVSLRLDYTARRFMDEELSDEGLMHVLSVGFAFGSRE